MATVVTKAELARRLAVSRAYVSQLDKAGRLVFADDSRKQVDYEATLQRIEDTKDPSKKGVADRHEKERTQKHGDELPRVTAPETPSTPPTDTPPRPRGTDPSDGDRFQASRAEKEGHLNEIARMQKEKMAGDLLEREGILMAVADILAELSQSLANIAPVMAPQMSDDQARNYDLLESYTDTLRTEIADRLQVLTADPLQAGAT